MLYLHQQLVEVCEDDLPLLPKVSSVLEWLELEMEDIAHEHAIDH